MTPAERVRSVLETAGSRRSGRDWQCPAHQDRKASLSVSEGRDGKAVPHCHAGCPTQAVLAALRLDWPDLFPESRNGKDELVATYDYTDEHDRLLYQAVRYFPNAFKRRRPDGHGGWIWKLCDTRLVLYRLPRVLAAVQAGQPVYVVEGEKDVHAIEQAGATATTIIGGVNGRWLPEFSRLLAKTRVLVVADDDPPGRKRATATARAIARLGGQVEVVRAAVGKDAADHLVAGLTLADLLPADQEPEPAPADPEPAEGSAESAESAESTPTWEPPAPLGPATEAPAFPVRALPGWLADYVQAEATATQTPPTWPACWSSASSPRPRPGWPRWPSGPAGGSRSTCTPPSA
jgi:putative DNA primase/helicase